MQSSLQHDRSTRIPSGSPERSERRASAQLSPLPMERDVVCLFGLAFDRAQLAETAERVQDAAAKGTRLHLATPNVNILRLAEADAELRDALLAADFVVPDGAPLALAARLLGVGLAGRVAGSDILDALRRDPERRTDAFFFGGDAAVGETLRRRYGAARTGVRFCGALDPGMGSTAEMSSPATLDAVNAARPDLVVVAVGSRKGLLWIARNERRLSAPVLAYLGAAIHFAAGTVERAPAAWRRFGMEWLWRIREEPKLWKRYAADALFLSRLGMTMIIPGMALRAFSAVERRVSRGERPGVEVRIDEATQDCRIALRGRFDAEAGGLLREALATASRRPRNIEVTLEPSARLDPSALGLVLVAYGQQRRHNLSLSLRAGSLRTRMEIKAQGCGFLMREGPARRPSSSPLRLVGRRGSPEARA